ncbi:MAG: hypothetical protein IJH84_04080 [Saccharopolyspora sp.]|uniref:hypothetical protein n=1 Tax=Saccharopolyspora TaxID=1835 RepID=UPI00190DBBF6|nr:MULTISPECIES: hypothetical protein [unclassified Saccharopolyspora]MBK0866827.1 hypothetical protein [Saccharopolyspora sp. HNM0986]MBQ6640196.1 hypothetical protein [Saccharopolyspora sp.]
MSSDAEGAPKFATAAHSCPDRAVVEPQMARKAPPRRLPSLELPAAGHDRPAGGGSQEVPIRW